MLVAPRAFMPSVFKIRVTKQRRRAYIFAIKFFVVICEPFKFSVKQSIVDVGEMMSSERELLRAL